MEEGRFWLYTIEKTTTDANEYLRHGLRVTNTVSNADTTTALLEDLTGKASVYKKDNAGVFLHSNMTNAQADPAGDRKPLQTAGRPPARAARRGALGGL